ncbi:hypothetical protein SUGI_0144920 [Cryptomeria japonica]|nr:hypothetical protein SUGI_0144920 [Cryptomeria japonica]
MEIPKDRFMLLLKEGMMIVYKVDIQSIHLFPHGKNKLNPEELDMLNKYLEEKEITKQETKDKNRDPKIRHEASWCNTFDLDNGPPLGTYDCDGVESTKM